MALSSGKCLRSDLALPRGRALPTPVAPLRFPNVARARHAVAQPSPSGQSATHRQDQTCRSYAGSGPNPSTQQRREAQLEKLRNELRALEAERDEAVSTAESCAKTCVRLSDMGRLLEDLALERVKAGDDAGAKQVLQEKNSLKEIIEKSNTKAQTNFALAGKLASLIGDKHNELVALLGGAAAGGAAAGGSSAAAPSAWGSSGAAASPNPSSSSSSSSSSRGGSAAPYGGSGGGGGGAGSWPEPWSTSAGDYSGYSSSSTAYGGAGGSGGSSTGYGGAGSGYSGSSTGYGDVGGGSGTSYGGAGSSRQLPWEQSLQSAQDRVRQAETEAQNMGRLAAMSAEDSIKAARERIAQRTPSSRAAPLGTSGIRIGGGEGILEARERLRRTAEGSIAEARERLRAQDAQILEYCRRIVARYRRGEYVAEDELEFAFEQLERRLL